MLAERATLTAEEAAVFEARAAELIRPEDSLPIGGEVSAYNNFWIDQGRG